MSESSELPSELLPSPLLSSAVVNRAEQSSFWISLKSMVFKLRFLSPFLSNHNLDPLRYSITFCICAPVPRDIVLL